MPEFFIYMDFLNFPLPVGVFIISFSASLCAVTPTLCAARAVGAVDIPRDGRRMHKKATPRAGGLAVFFAFAVALLFYERGELSGVSGSILSGGAVMTALGFCDDVSPLPPRVKLAGQACAATIPLSFGIFMRDVSFFGFSLTLPRLFGLSFSFLWIVTLSNAINLIDGLDGLASGVSFFVLATLFARCTVITKNAETAVISAALAGAVAGFLPYNARNAKIFLGDCGSLSLGYIIAVLTLADGSSAYGKSFTPLAFLLMLAYPITDTVMAVIRRAKSGSGIFCADRKHIHHRLCDALQSKEKAATLLVCSTALLCAISLLV